MKIVTRYAREKGQVLNHDTKLKIQNNIQKIQK